MELTLEQRIEAVQKLINSDQEELAFADGQSHYNLLREINENFSKLHQLKVALSVIKLEEKKRKIKSRHIRRSLNRNPK